jgi:BirA family biotin operon repressor/biotin-[acetyl-CoA-carboxylase] ligase
MVIGVGVNVGRSPQLALNSESQSARGLADVLGRDLQRYDLLAGMVTSILNSIEEALTGSEAVVAEFRTRCLLTGRRVRFLGGAQPCEGNCLGVAGNGALIVETATGTRQLHSGEAMLVRPTARPE